MHRVPVDIRSVRHLRQWPADTAGAAADADGIFVDQQIDAAASRFCGERIKTWHALGVRECAQRVRGE